MNSKNAYILATQMREFPVKFLFDEDPVLRTRAATWLQSIKALALHVSLESHEGETDEEKQAKKRERDEIDAEIRAFIDENKKDL